jgi:hypothetical protein
MQRAITWRSTGQRSDGRRCTITEVTEYEPVGWPNAVPRGSYVLVDHESATRLDKGRYRILPRDEVVTCDDPNAP